MSLWSSCKARLATAELINTVCHTVLFTNTLRTAQIRSSRTSHVAKFSNDSIAMIRINTIWLKPIVMLNYLLNYTWFLFATLNISQQSACMMHPIPWLIPQNLHVRTSRVDSVAYADLWMGLSCCNAHFKRSAKCAGRVVDSCSSAACRPTRACSSMFLLDLRAQASLETFSHNTDDMYLLWLNLVCNISKMRPA